MVVTGASKRAAKKPRLTNDEHPPSLLTLGDPLGSILRACDVVSVCRMERTCKALNGKSNALVKSHWDHLDASVPTKFRSAVGADGKERFSRYYRGHEFAKRMEPLLDSHVSRFDKEELGFIVKCKGCDAFPEELCTDIYCNPDDYELFLRCSRKVGDEFVPLDPRVKCEGFVAFRAVTDNIHQLILRSLHFRLEDYAPPELAQVLRDVAEDKRVGDHEVEDIVVTLLAVNKETGKIELVTGVDGLQQSQIGNGLTTAGIVAHHMKTAPHSFIPDICIRTIIGNTSFRASGHVEMKVRIGI